MASPIGFVLLTHDKPQQAIRLASRLNYMFDQPPIAWHHDSTVCSIPSESITHNVLFARPHLRTSWGTFSVIDATIIALEMLYNSHSSPDWIILLSGSDYPIKAATTIVHDLSTSPFDVHLHNEKIVYNSYSRDWQLLCYGRYCGVNFRVPFLNRRLRPVRRMVTLHDPVFTTWFTTPFSRGVSCFAGDHWFCANRAAIAYLLEYHRTKPALARSLPKAR